jgi:hypothetical protein
VAWIGSRPGFSRLAEGAIAVATVGTIISFFWVPRWWYTPSELVALAEIPYPLREFAFTPVISESLDLHSGSAITGEVGLAREQRVGPGAVVAFGSPDGNQPALFWNNTFSNRVVYVAPGPDFVERVKQTGAIWLYCNYDDPTYLSLISNPEWTELGALNVERWGSIFQRLGP